MVSRSHKATMSHRVHDNGCPSWWGTTISTFLLFSCTWYRTSISYPTIIQVSCFWLCLTILPTIENKRNVEIVVPHHEGQPLSCTRWLMVALWDLDTMTKLNHYFMVYICLIDSAFKFVDLVELWPQIGPNWTSFPPPHPLLRAPIDVSQRHDHPRSIWKVCYKFLWVYNLSVSESVGGHGLRFLRNPSSV